MTSHTVAQCNHCRALLPLRLLRPDSGYVGGIGYVTDGWHCLDAVKCWERWGYLQDTKLEVGA